MPSLIIHEIENVKDRKSLQDKSYTLASIINNLISLFFISHLFMIKLRIHHFDPVFLVMMHLCYLFIFFFLITL